MKAITYGVIGLGAVGRVIAAHLLQARHKVLVLTRQVSNCEKLLAKPLSIVGEATANAQVTHCFSELAEFIAAKPDVVLICTKNTDSKALLTQINALNPAPEMLFVSCQNGIDVEDQISEIFGRKRALRLVLNMGCSISGDNEVRVNFFMPHYLSDLPFGAAYAQQIANELTAAGFTTQVKTDYRVETFKKALLNSSLGSLCAITRQTMSFVMDRPEMRSLVKQIVQEGIAIAQAMNISIASDFVDQAMLYLEKGGDHKPSVLVDIENNRKTENDYHCGKLAKYAQEYDVKVKLIPIISNLIKTIESK
jgi:2-dehydropantoate 2-reductase